MSEEVLEKVSRSKEENNVLWEISMMGLTKEREDQIDRILEKIREVWKSHPALRLCQLLNLISNLGPWMQTDLYHVPDSLVEEGLSKVEEFFAKAEKNRCR